MSQVYLDDATAEPTFVAARVGFFGNKEVLVPLVGAFISDDLMQVPHSADLVKQAPAPSPHRRLSPPPGAGAYRHYDLAFPIPPAGPGRAAPPPASVGEEADTDPQDRPA